MDPARAQGGADACAAIEAKKPVAVHGRSAPSQTTTQESNHEDRRGQDDDRSRRRSAGDHPARPRIARPGGRRTRRTARIADRDSTGWNECSERRRIRRQVPRELPSGEAGLGVRCARIPHAITRRSMDRSRSGRCGGAVGPENDLQRRPAISYLSRRINRREAWDERLVVSARRHCDAHRSDGCDRRSRPLAEGCQSP